VEAPTLVELGIGEFPDRGCDSPPMLDGRRASDDHIAGESHRKGTP
jgi:hypothetical protein